VCVWCSSSKQAEQAWPLQQLCTSRPLPRRHDPEPLGGLSPAEFRKFSKAGAEVLGLYPVLLDAIGESRSCHRTGRSFRDMIDQLVQLLCCHPCACSHVSCQQREQLMTTPAELGAYNHLKLTHNTFLPRIRLAWRVLIATGPRPCFRGHGPPINKAQRSISRAKSPWT
jgi:hypothetical protein